MTGSSPLVRGMIKPSRAICAMTPGRGMPDTSGGLPALAMICGSKWQSRSSICSTSMPVCSVKTALTALKPMPSGPPQQVTTVTLGASWASRVAGMSDSTTSARTIRKTNLRMIWPFSFQKPCGGPAGSDKTRMSSRRHILVAASAGEPNSEAQMAEYRHLLYMATQSLRATLRIGEATITAIQARRGGWGGGVDGALLCSVLQAGRGDGVLDDPARRR